LKKFSILILLIPLLACQPTPTNLPDGFVYLDSYAPDIQTDIRYYSIKNFIGDTIDAYYSDRCIITEAAARSLKNIQEELKSDNLGLLVYDAYRPQEAVDHFVRWAKDLADTLNKATYYPTVPKNELFKRGYIAERSGHTRGSTVDLTIIDLDTKETLDMGTTWDYLDPKSWPTDSTVSQTQMANRLKLQALMVKYGFRPLKEEWWHFTLIDEPFPDTYFNFPVQ
jgi:D-alanyl-D-alanine dipeptidase